MLTAKQTWTGLVLSVALVASAPSQAIVTNHPAAGTAADPHLVDGPVQVDDLVAFPFHRPSIPTDGIVELYIEKLSTPQMSQCSGAVVDTAEGPAVLTAAHCIAFGSLRQVKTRLDVFGTPTVFETCHVDDDKGCDIDTYVLIHPQYRFDVFEGYDLALIYFTTPIPSFGTRRYAVADADLPLDGWHSFVKFGYGCHGNGMIGVDTEDPSVFDHQLRWAMNSWDSDSLGSYGVTVGGETFSNFHTQLTYDFDNGTVVDHNLYNFYGNTFDPKTAETVEYVTCFGPCGIQDAEGGSCSGDSGGPNFIYDEAAGRWVIRAVNSYALRMDDDWNGFHGNSDIDGPSSGAFGRNFSAGEFGADALVTPQMLNEILNDPLSPAAIKQEVDQQGLGSGPVKSRQSSIGSLR